MDGSIAQIEMSALMARSGLSDAQLAIVLDVNQSTISRLRNCKIAKVDRHRQALEQHIVQATGSQVDELDALIDLARRSPPLRELFVTLMHLLHKNA